MKASRPARILIPVLTMIAWWGCARRPNGSTNGSAAVEFEGVVSDVNQCRSPDVVCLLVETSPTDRVMVRTVSARRLIEMGLSVSRGDRIGIEGVTTDAAAAPIEVQAVSVRVVKTGRVHLLGFGRESSPREAKH